MATIDILQHRCLSDSLPVIAKGTRCWHKMYDKEIEIVNGRPDCDGDYWVICADNPTWVFAVPYGWILSMEKDPLIALKP